MAPKTILAVAGDRGGWNAIEPVLKRALDAGHTVHALFSGTCARQLETRNLKPDIRLSCTVIRSETSYLGSDLILVGSSQSKEGTASAREALLSAPEASCVIMQDMYGSAHPTLRDLNRSVNSICVTDSFSKDLLTQAVPQYAGALTITGNPYFDRYVQLRQSLAWNDEWNRIRNDFRIGPKKFVLLVVGGLNGTADMLEIVEGALRNMNLLDSAYVLLRTHPRATSLDVMRTDTYISVQKPAWLRRVSYEEAQTSEDLLPAVNLVISPYSTTNHVALACQGWAACFGTESIRNDLFREKSLERPPEVTAGAGWYVENSSDLEEVIGYIHPGLRDPAFEAREKSRHTIRKYNDGEATRRVWREVEKLLM